MLNVDTFWFLIKGSGKVCNFDLYRPIQAVDFGRWQSIEGEIDRRRSIVGEKGKKKKKRKRRKKKRGEEEPTFHVTSLFALRCRPRLRALFLPCGERAGEDVVDCGRKREEEEEKKKQKEEPTFHATSSFTCCRHPRPRALFLPRRETFGDVLARIPSPPLPAGAFSLVRGDGRSPRAGRKIEATCTERASFLSDWYVPSVPSGMVKKMLAEGHYEMTEYIIGNLDKEDQDANEQRMPYPFYPSKAGMKPNFLADIISRSADS
ncbi:hypothetical protein GW17_00023620 [Ensete ventricosum]|nr:hypothetical protein GW17_00023620 [Ensete ventricosum]